MQFFEPAPFAITDPLLARLYAYWNMKRGSYPMPKRRDIDPVELGYILGNINLIDVLRDPVRFLIRIHGTELVRREGEDRTSKTIEELPQAEFSAVARAHFTAVVETGVAHRSVSDRMLDGRVMHYEAILMPLSDDRKTVDRILIGTRHS